MPTSWRLEWKHTFFYFHNFNIYITIFLNKYLLISVYINKYWKKYIPTNRSEWELNYCKIKIKRKIYQFFVDFQLRIIFNQIYYKHKNWTSKKSVKNDISWHKQILLFEFLIRSAKSEREKKRKIIEIKTKVRELESNKQAIFHVFSQSLFK